MDTFMNFLPLIVAVTGLSLVVIVMILFVKEVFYLEAKTQLTIITILLVSTMVCVKVSAIFFKDEYYSKKDESYYAEIEDLSQNGYVVYVDGSAVDFDKIVISDYSTEKIHINDELKEIYISK